MNKIVINCETGESEEVELTKEEIAQREYEASLPKSVPPKTDIEILKETVDALVLASLEV